MNLLKRYPSCRNKGICLESRYPRYTCSSDFTFPLAVGAYGSLQLLIQPWICALGTHYGWVDQGSVEYEVCLTPLHMASTGNRHTYIYRNFMCKFHQLSGMKYRNFLQMGSILLDKYRNFLQNRYPPCGKNREILLRKGTHLTEKVQKIYQKQPMYSLA